MSVLSTNPGEQREKELLVQCPRVSHPADRVSPDVTACKQHMSPPSCKKPGEIAARKAQPQAKCQQVTRCAMLCFSCDFHSALEEFFPLFRRIC